MIPRPHISSLSPEEAAQYSKTERENLRSWGIEVPEPPPPRLPPYSRAEREAMARLEALQGSPNFKPGIGMTAAPTSSAVDISHTIFNPYNNRTYVPRQSNWTAQSAISWFTNFLSRS